MKKILSTFILIASLISISSPIQLAHAAGANDLVKCEDFSAVYYLAEDGKRYVFPNEQIYHSWYSDFHDVKTISCEDLASIPLGDLIVYQAGTRLVKIPSDPSVFVVENDGVLREIPDESTAIALFGDDWFLRVDDVSEAFWSSFTVGEPLVEDEIPEGTILEDEDGNLYRTENDGTATEINAVLTIDQEEVLKEHAQLVDDLEERLGVALALTHVSNETAIAVLEELIARLRTVNVDEDNITDVDEFDEIEDETDSLEDAQDAIDDAADEIAEAEEDLAEDAEDGKDVSASEILLISAREHLALAQVALAAGDNTAAEEHADEARHDAMWARGKAVESIDDNDDENEIESDDEDMSDINEPDDASDDDETDEEDSDSDDDLDSDDTDDTDDSDDSSDSDDDSSESESDDSV